MYSVPQTGPGDLLGCGMDGTYAGIRRGPQTVDVQYVWRSWLVQSKGGRGLYAAHNSLPARDLQLGFLDDFTWPVVTKKLHHRTTLNGGLESGLHDHENAG